MRSLYAEGSPRPEPLAFTKVRGSAWPDDYEDDYGLWMHENPIPSDGPIWLFIKMSELPRDMRGPHKHLWEADLIAVSPFFARDAAIIGALNSAGDYLEEVWGDLPRKNRLIALCELLIDYGTKANMASRTSRRAHGAFKGAAQEAAGIHFFWGFRADQPQNALGATGWDFLRGEIVPGISTLPKKKPSTFQKAVIRWLNNQYEKQPEGYPTRREYQRAVEQ